jgi:hypothetical protein
MVIERFPEIRRRSSAAQLIFVSDKIEAEAPCECRDNFIWVDVEPDTFIPFEQPKHIGPMV